MRILLRTMVAAGSLAAALAASPMPAAASWLIPPYPYWAKDFAILKHDGAYHIFYIRRDVSLPYAQNEIDFGHAVSFDLYHWTHLPPVMAVRDSAWDDDHVWAPSIVERDGLFSMFYTGVTDRPIGPRLWQRTGLATSTDLLNWVRRDAPILTCHDIPWALCDSTYLGLAFRDPCVVADPLRPGRWLMVYSGMSSGDPYSLVAALASSDGDFTRWEDVAPLWVSYRNTTGSGLAESPSLFVHDGTTYLFFTTGYAQALHFATSADPLAPPAQWTYRGALSDMLGTDTRGWFASEQLQDGLLDYFAFVNGGFIDVRRMEWQPGGGFQLVEPDPFHVVHMRWSADSARAGDTLSLIVEAVNGSGRALSVEVLEVAPDGTEIPVDPAQWGIAPPPPVLSGASTAWVWTPTGAPDPLPDGSTPRLVVRTLDRTCRSGPLTLRPPLPPQPSPPPGPPPRFGSDEFSVVSMQWSTDSARAGDTLALVIETVNAVNAPASFEVLEVAPGGTETLVDPAQFGIQPPPVLNDALTVWSWTPTSAPASLADGSAPGLVIRTVDRTCRSDTLTLRPAPAPPPTPPWPGHTRTLGSPVIRQVVNYEFGARPAVVVEMPAEASVRLDLYDLQGRRLRTLADRVLERGAHVIPWDGRDEAGRRAPGGLYFARLVSGTSAVTIRLFLR